MTRKFVGWLLGGVLLLIALPHLLLMGFGLYRGHDVLAGLGSYWHRPEGTTIDPEHVPYAAAGEVEWKGHLQSERLIEASGLALSRQGDALWAHNDSGNEHEIHALDLRGGDLGRVPIAAPPLGDWEDMAAFELAGKRYLLIGDVGDNLRWRRVLHLHAIEEPPIPGRGVIGPEVPIAWSVSFRYPDGHHDCEALAVDLPRERVLLLSKRTIPSEVYSVPLRPPESAAPVVAERIAVLDTIPQPDASDRALDLDMWSGNAQPTAFDIAGDVAVAVTYRDAYRFTRQPGEDWAAALARVPERIGLPSLRGREAAALTADARYLYVTSERDGPRPALLFRVDLRPQQASATDASAPLEAPAATPDAGTGDAGTGDAG